MYILKFGSRFSSQKSYDYLYGINPVMSALYANKRSFTQLYVNQTQQNDYINPRVSNILNRAQSLKLDVQMIPKNKLERYCSNDHHQNVILKCSKLNYCNQLPDESNFVLLDSVQDPQNFGAILRVCFFLGINTVIVEKKGQCPLSPTVSKTSAGALELMNIFETDNLANFVKQRKHEFQVIGSGFESNSIPIDEFQKDQNKPKKIIIFGSESSGIRTELFKQCDTIVNIMTSRHTFPETLVDSLNVSVSAGIILQSVLNSK
ncbi:unnamed protein product (macronuclear) [Paramecium tetraurelia]|uniref:rRNA methyltransferase 1, mitochondrial n=1 Tax=Paramecium tetraurelia TaxID=5888 RepID=A0CRZ1_PARTE|nr:uncharacterized protein GSPATT00038908001 [Paramecium tetraurelia]CAK73558.1 unnamed protein product [Paramecium tetraurelia]|eukprot:XP_001440955.1 hypothetical protein (macronuclear) [Paramecium tetraurelia strain d4-2]